MKKTILILSILTAAIFAKEPYPLSEQITLKEAPFSYDATYQDWCIDRQVWREYNAHSRGSLSQILHSKNDISPAVPLPCSLYSAWKDNIKRLDRVDAN